MSDTADEDDGIDKEALREELREKYERDEREREATRRMSDLLLKGATMTNSHCGTCHDPLFRQDGVTFCPTCHGGPGGVEAAVDDSQQPRENQPAADDVQQSGARRGTTDFASEPQAPDDSAPSPSESPTDAPTSHEVGDSSASESSEETPSPELTADADETVSTDDLDWGSMDGDDGWSFVAGETATDQSVSDAVDSDGDSPSADSPSNVETAATDAAATDVDTSDVDTTDVEAIDSEPAIERPTAAVEGDDFDLTTAYESQVRALERFSAEAADTDDPRYARECLGAAREAAKALAVLRALRA